MSWLERTGLLLGADALATLRKASVCVFGIGGVGSYAAEALARSGVGRLTLVDGDTVSQTNINRQLIALRSTVGQHKTDAMAARIRDINPDAHLVCHSVFYTPENADTIPLDVYDYVVDAIDMVTSKLAIIERAHLARVPVISSMGMGNKLDPSLIAVKDIGETSVCPLARVMRRELKKRGIGSLKVVCSTEPPVQKPGGQSGPPGSVAFVPSVAGLMIAGAVVRDLIK